MPTYNRAHLVGMTLDTVFQQRCEDFEVIVVDDGSTDGTVDVVRGYGDRVLVLQQDHGGCAAARNLGVRHASGEYLIFLDSDDLWFPWSLSVFDEVIRSHAAPAVVAGQLMSFVDPNELDGIMEEPISARAYPDYFQGAWESSFFLGTGICAIKKSSFVEAGGFIERDITATDSDVLFRLGTAPGFVKIDRPVLLGYRYHESNILKNPGKLLGGAYLMLESEQNGQYPGGQSYRRLREAQIGVRCRAMSLSLLRKRHVWQACGSIVTSWR